MPVQRLVHRRAAGLFVPRCCGSGFLLLLLCCIVSTASAGPTPGQRCEAGKNLAAGKYALCRQHAHATVARTGATSKYDEAILKCSYKLAHTWQILEARAGSQPCPDEPLDATLLRNVIDECTTNVATALHGGALPDCPADLAMCEADLEQARACGNGQVDVNEDCDHDNLNGRTCATEGFIGGTLTCGSGCAFDTAGCFSARFVDNEDQTITDHLTRLQWEKKTGSSGSPIDCSATPCVDPHNVNNLYKWSNSGNDPDGGAFTDFLGKLNACQDDSNGISPPTGLIGGFAGHCDWRVPTALELESLMLAQYPCHPSPCIDPAFAPTGLSQGYWSSTTRATHPDIAWAILFSDGFIMFADPKTDPKYVRAVRNIP